MNNLTHKQASIQLRGIKLNCHLGWSAEERANKQAVFLDVVLRFNQPPKAAITDDLQDTHCYDTLIKHITAATEKQEYRLIERLAAHVYQVIREALPDVKSIQVSILKNPKDYIANLTNGVIFAFGDEV